MKFPYKIINSVTIFIALILISSYFYSNVEGWRYLDSLYFSVATVTTVGYGDVVPLTDLGKIYTMFFSFTGIAFALYLFGVIGKKINKGKVYRQNKLKKA